MARTINAWFINFFNSFKEGDNRISEKQFDVFAKYLGEWFEDGFISGYRGEVEGFKVQAYRWDCKGGARFYVEKTRIGAEAQKRAQKKAQKESKKMYYFSFEKHAHDLEFRRNRLKNTIDDMVMSDGTPDFNLMDKMEEEIHQLEEIMEYWDGNPASKIPAYLYGVAMDAVLWASNARAETCIENGRPDLVQYC